MFYNGTMGNILLLLQVLIFGISAPSASVKKEGAKIYFKETTKKLGDISVGERYEHVFTFTNTGDEPLIIKDTETSCGCTVVKFSKEPIMPGKQGEIKVDYVPKKGTKGFISKSVIVSSNATNSPAYLYFQGNVVKKDKKKKK